MTRTNGSGKRSRRRDAERKTDVVVVVVRAENVGRTGTRCKGADRGRRSSGESFVGYRQRLRWQWWLCTTPSQRRGRGGESGTVRDADMVIYWYYGRVMRSEIRSRMCNFVDIEEAGDAVVRVDAQGAAMQSHDQYDESL